MEPFEVGQHVNVLCEIYPGPFPDEHLVTINTQDGKSSGFVRAEYVTMTQKPHGSIQGIIAEINGDTITVQLPGSFFTTAMGLTTFPTSWANDHVTVAA